MKERKEFLINSIFQSHFCPNCHFNHNQKIKKLVLKVSTRNERLIKQSYQSRESKKLRNYWTFWVMRRMHVTKREKTHQKLGQKIIERNWLYLRTLFTLPFSDFILGGHKYWSIKRKYWKIKRSTSERIKTWKRKFMRICRKKWILNKIYLFASIQFLLLKRYLF